MSVEAAIFGTDLFGDPIAPKASGPVAEKFVFPPFSVLDARQGDWQERKRAWVSVGIQSEVGRSAKSYNTNDWMNEKAGGQRGQGDGTSIFDPVLCEMLYRWFCPPFGQVVDPFAGGSVRGVVAAFLGLKYWGCDLRQEQVTANIHQAKKIIPHNAPNWVCGDSMDELEKAPNSDFIFSCPPYGDLEQYSDDPRDLSAMDWHTFRAAYRRIILRSISRLKPNRFACFVVGDFRDSRGHYRNFVGDTTAAFIECGAELYNEAVLVTPVGTACLRVTKQFDSGRKFAKTHQNVLVFVKGDWKKAATACKTPLDK